eukprot:TRINITY_DN68666_c0_g1_i1.p1 TRINITY_DN68666_c0_g1~~TRINITY_DN68666_c0_g1_i1.p1  ORF type:complete len:166 (+),score=21.47 TRINITY_DN68666_c0_g1_i1:176-673(+)
MAMIRNITAGRTGEANKEAEHKYLRDTVVSMIERGAMIEVAEFVHARASELEPSFSKLTGPTVRPAFSLVSGWRRTGDIVATVAAVAFGCVHRFLTRRRARLIRLWSYQERPGSWLAPEHRRKNYEQRDQRVTPRDDARETSKKKSEWVLSRCINQHGSPQSDGL